jgi:uncharacterized HAD superfamily protein
VDLVVGVPRSGMLAANLVALHCNLALTDVDGLLAGRIMKSGLQRADIGRQCDTVESCRKILVVDDSIVSGTEMSRVRSVIDATGLSSKVLYLAVIYTRDREADIDIGFDLCPTPRIFEWNVMHGHMLPKCCVDIDGVLCIDPTDEENDDGERYLDFLQNAQLLIRPTATIGTLVTSRLEKYRGETEAWLHKHDIRFERLVMMQYATMAERQAARAYTEFKAGVFSESSAELFIESSDEDAMKIAKLSGKPALCPETQTMYAPSGIPHVKQQIKAGVQESRSLAFRAVRKLKRIVVGA